MDLSFTNKRCSVQFSRNNLFPFHPALLCPRIGLSIGQGAAEMVAAEVIIKVVFSMLDVSSNAPPRAFPVCR